MSLILAIEADRRQANLLASIGRTVGAELVIAPDAERGLAAIDGRVPDLILTSALLSPRDDAAIAARLRELDAAAAHVQMLTIPLLAKSSRRHVSPAGLLGKLRGAAAQSGEPEGCDPSLFAEQVSEYLQRSAAERRAREPQVQASHHQKETAAEAAGREAPAVAAPIGAAEFETTGDVTAVTPAEAPIVHDEPPAVETMAIVHASAHAEVPVEPERVEEPQPAPPAPEPPDTTSEEIELIEELEAAAPEVFELTTTALDAEVEAALRDFENVFAASDALVATAAKHRTPPRAPAPPPAEPAPATLDDAQIWSEFEKAAAKSSPPERTDTSKGSTAADHSPRPPATRSPGSPARGDTAHANAENRQQERQPEKEKKRGARKAKPAQDEWGLFDPDQCGFAALLEKLDEIAASADDAA